MHSSSPIALLDRLTQVSRFSRTLLPFARWSAVSAICFAAAWRMPQPVQLPGEISFYELVGVIAAIVAAKKLAASVTTTLLAHRGRPKAESQMLGRVYRLLAGLCIVVATAYAVGKLGSFGTFFTLFGGMLLGWSLQAPISGFAAWVLVSITRPFRPGDRVRFPAIALKGDVLNVGLLYTELNQIGGAIGSDEGEGRRVLIPNAMLFSQVVVNYTVEQHAAYVLDEIVLRVTYDSDWDAAERIMLAAAREITADIIRFTGTEPYIRAETYDYGVYLKLRYKTPVKERAEIAYRLSKRIYHEIRSVPDVDLAIPYVYSYRAGLDRKNSDATANGGDRVQEIEIDRIRAGDVPVDQDDVAQVAQSIAEHGLLQPVIVVPASNADFFDLVLGDLRLAAYRHLNRRTIPAIVRSTGATRTAASDRSHARV